MEPGGSAATPTVGVRQRLWRWVSGWGFKEWRRVALVAVLAGTAAFGGLDTVNDHITDIAPGEAFNTGEFEMTVQRATLVTEVRAGDRVLFAAKPGSHYLGLVVTAHNIGTLPGVVDKPIRLIDQPAAEALAPMRMADGTIAGRLGPGLTDEIVLLWRLPEHALAVGAQLPVRVYKEVRKASVTAGQAWVRGDDYAQLTVPVRGRP
ncbi:uncharacterized protein RMCC_5042 [Mycolicibacterium canariasense]|uniref:Uncharacterized protein n=1 Tax=Mycolicibacterium canariasense TaxID=228230 RepID=A0A100WGD7_MYCCR|nr:hypothetical protein [Mycolicibacterium canariasense]MCV7212939.1 hypothetical protein [Mycolicibacterium canariasense]ORV10258.1 hypothetical protein AWB94_08060 [Mycolicibacterium canariasense]GAS98077.1 uncharacterized protein RMCC_5042 [Mycolicibacterium canariasense]